MSEVESSFEEMEVNSESDESVAASGASVNTVATSRSYADVASSRKIQWTEPSVKVFDAKSKPSVRDLQAREVPAAQVYSFQIKDRNDEEEAIYQDRLEAFRKRNNIPTHGIIAAVLKELEAMI